MRADTPSNERSQVMPVNIKKIRVVVVDDSALIRNVLTTIINEAPDMEVVATAADPILARERIRATNPDVVTLDVEMPRMDVQPPPAAKKSSRVGLHHLYGGRPHTAFLLSRRPRTLSISPEARQPNETFSASSGKWDLKSGRKSSKHAGVCANSSRSVPAKSFIPCLAFRAACPNASRRNSKSSFRKWQTKPVNLLYSHSACSTNSFSGIRHM